MKELRLDIHSMRSIYRWFRQRCFFVSVRRGCLFPEEICFLEGPSKRCFVCRFPLGSEGGWWANRSCKTFFRPLVLDWAITGLTVSHPTHLKVCFGGISSLTFDPCGTGDNATMISLFSGSSFPFIFWVRFPCHRDMLWCLRVPFWLFPKRRSWISWNKGWPGLGSRLSQFLRCFGCLILLGTVRPCPVLGSIVSGLRM